MTNTRTLLRTRTISFGVVGVIAAGAMFASGVLVARATMDDGNTGSATPPANSANPSNTARSLVAPAPATGSTDAAMGTGKGGGSSSSAPALATLSSYGPGGACAESIAGTLSGTAIDPAKAGFASKLLKDGFTLTGMSFGSYGNCDVDGKATDAHLVLGTQWKYDDTITVMVAQRQGVDENTPNLIQQGNATFTAEGYTYNVWANNSTPIAVDAGSDGAAQPLPLPIRPQNDAEAAKALEAAIGQLAPGIDAQCFWRQTDGTWSDLAALGIGDPRPAVPSSFTQSGITLTRYQPPAAGCASASLPFARQVNVYAAFSDSNGNQLSANVNGGEGGIASGPGHLGDNNASWSNGTYYFSVFGNGDGVNRDVIRRVATALDPSFANACLITTRNLSDGDVARLGVHAPTAPAGYHLEQSSFTGTDGTPGCGSSTSGGFSLNWMMVNESKGGYIEAGIMHGALDPSMGIGPISNTSLVWKDDAGNTYHVSALKADVSRDMLLGVARSMDPKFSEDRLEKNPSGNGGIVPPGTRGSPRQPAPQPAAKPN
jgi:hypothetical protein